MQTVYQMVKSEGYIKNMYMAKDILKSDLYQLATSY